MLPFPVDRIEQYRALQQNAAKPYLLHFPLATELPSERKLTKSNRQIPDPLSDRLSRRDFANVSAQNMACLTQKNEVVLTKWAPTSNRFWPTNRSYRKQTTKPCLTGTRTHIKDLQKLRRKMQRTAPGPSPISPSRETAPPCRNLQRILLHQRHRAGDVSLRNAILPGKVIFVPQRPHETQHQRSPRQQVTEAAPQQLPSIGRGPVQTHRRKTEQLHPGGSLSASREERKIERIKKKKRGEIHHSIRLLHHHLPAQRPEQPEKPGVREPQEDGVKKSSLPPLDKARAGDKRRLRMRPLVRRARKIQFGLDVYLHAFRLALRHTDALLFR